MYVPKIKFTCILLSVVLCSMGPAPRNGFVDSDDAVLRPGSIVSYSCRKEYDLEGDEERVCLESGELSGLMPSCTSGMLKVQRCGPLYFLCVFLVRCNRPNVDDNVIIDEDKPVYQTGDKFSYKCPRGYLLDGPQWGFCKPEGIVPSTIPKCIKCKFSTNHIKFNTS